MAPNLNICTPALVYLIISSITILYIFTQQFTFLTISLKILFVILWTWILNYICSKGYSTISWVLVLLPYVIAFGFLLLVLEFTNKINGYLSNTIISKQQYYIQPITTPIGTTASA